MRTQVSFKLPPESLNLIESLAIQLNTTKTKVIERSIKTLANKKLNPTNFNPLLKYSNTLSNKEAESMLETISQSRKNDTTRFTDNI